MVFIHRMYRCWYHSYCSQKRILFSIITTVIAAVLTVVSVFAVQFTLVNGKVAGGGLKYVNVNLPDIL